MKKAQKFFATNKLGIDDSDTITNPHGFRNSEDRIVEELQKIRPAIDDNQDNPTEKISQKLMWHDKQKGEYKFGDVVFSQGGRIRKKVFTTMMDTYDKSHGNVSIRNIIEATNLTAARVRTDVFFINKRLSKKTKYYFRASRQGFYTLDEYK